MQRSVLLLAFTAAGAAAQVYRASFWSTSSCTGTPLSGHMDASPGACVLTPADIRAIFNTASGSASGFVVDAAGTSLRGCSGASLSSCNNAIINSATSTYCVSFAWDGSSTGCFYNNGVYERIDLIHSPPPPSASPSPPPPSASPSPPPPSASPSPPPPSAPPASPPPSQVGLFIGAGAGGVCLIILIVVAVICCMKQSKKPQDAGTTAPSKKPPDAGTTAPSEASPPVETGAISIAIPVTPDAPKKDMTTQLKEAKEMLDTGILTQEEFDAEKKKILKAGLAA